MTVTQNVEYLLSHNKKFDSSVLYDKDKHGMDFCEMIIPNASQPSFPITVTVSEEGCSLSVGQFENVTGSSRMTPEQALSAFDDIMADKIVFVLAYKDDGDIGFGAPYFSRVFALTGSDDDMSDDYNAFIAKINKPINKHLRFLTSLKGRFFIFNFSGSLRKNITR